MLRPAADDVDLVKGEAQHVLDLFQGLSIGERQALQAGSHEGALGGGDRLAAALTEQAQGGGHVGRGEQVRVVRIDQRPKGGRRACHLGQVGVGPGMALPRPRSLAFLDQPQPADVLEQPCRAVHPAFIGQVGAPRGVAEDRGAGLGSDERPGAGADIGAARSSQGDPHHRRAGVVAGGGDDLHLSPQSGSLLDFGPQWAEDGPRRQDGRQNGGGQVELVQQATVPIARPRVAHLAGAGDGPLRPLRAAEPVVEQVGDHQQAVGGVKGHRPRLTHGEELVEGIEAEKLDAGRLEKSLAAYLRQGQVEHPLGAAVAVVVGQADQRIVTAKQGEVYPPRIQANTADLAPWLVGLGQTIEDAGVEGQDIPVQTLRHAHRTVGEAVQNSHVEPVAVELTAHHTPALGAQVEG